MSDEAARIFERERRNLGLTPADYLRYLANEASSVEIVQLVKELLPQVVIVHRQIEYNPHLTVEGIFANADEARHWVQQLGARKIENHPYVAVKPFEAWTEIRSNGVSIWYFLSRNPSQNTTTD